MLLITILTYVLYYYLNQCPALTFVESIVNNTNVVVRVVVEEGVSTGGMKTDIDVIFTVLQKGSKYEIS